MSASGIGLVALAPALGSVVLAGAAVAVLGAAAVAAGNAIALDEAEMAVRLRRIDDRLRTRSNLRLEHLAEAEQARFNRIITTLAPEEPVADAVPARKKEDTRDPVLKLSPDLAALVPASERDRIAALMTEADSDVAAEHDLIIARQRAKRLALDRISAADLLEGLGAPFAPLPECEETADLHAVRARLAEVRDGTAEFDEALWSRVDRLWSGYQSAFLAHHIERVLAKHGYHTAPAQTGVPEDGRLRVRRQDSRSHLTRVHIDGENISFQVCRTGETNRSEDSIAEQSWCDDLPTIMSALEEDGIIVQLGEFVPMGENRLPLDGAAVGASHTWDEPESLREREIG